MAINLPDNDKVAASLGAMVDAKGAPVTPPTNATFTWAAVQTGGTGTFGTITPNGPNPSQATSAVFFAGMPPAVGYIKLTVTLPTGVLVGQSQEIDLTVGLPVSVTIVLGAPTPV